MIDNATASRLKTQFAAHLREQITLGIPTGQDEAGLRRFARQLRAGQVVVKLFLPYPLHAKLYLLFRDDVNNPITGFVGSSNLTLSGLSGNGELNVDVLDHMGIDKLSKWFDARWADRWALDVSLELATIIETSWAREEPIPPKHRRPIKQTGDVMPTNAKVGGDVHALVREVVCHRQAYDAPGDGARPTNGITNEVHASQVWLTAKAATSGTRTPMRLTFLRFLIDRPSAV